MIKGIIFDLDGTLINTIVDIANSVNAVLEDYGYNTYTIEEVQKKVGHGFKQLLKDALPANASNELQVEAVEKFMYYYDKFYADNTHPYDGIIDMLRGLQERGIKIAINTNKHEEYARILVSELFKDINFVDIRGQLNTRPIKPDPYNANIIIEEMGLDKSKVIFTGDSATDIKTGNNLGVSTIGVTWGYREVDELKENGATYIVNHPSEILDIVK